ncbi:cytochrome P450 [Candidatus Mycobacterium wuenschmannii]|uniref:Cytochrome P450 n=1 Tax=Candidatus Mycobacterium wuenschmannii TaxID=3027808 RepID=A0ABY8W2Y5_9MYCO|nr:cytochrome P450 [Candidatus Mycobacterium wuenschmannii]WIM90258.1 cytochrome P450 [Candidatus Mycobacterium wuenschmannii]
MLGLLARRNDPMAKLLTIDSNPVDDIYPLIEQVRARGRMSRVAGAGWVCADARILRELLRDSRIRTAKPSDRAPFRLGQWILARTDPGVMNPIEPPSMLVTDPPDHARLRQPVTRAFTPRALDRLRAGIQDLVDGLLDGLDGRTDCDLFTEYASQIPMAVIADLMGMPRDDTPYLLHVAETATSLLGSVGPSWRHYRAGTDILREFERYVGDHIARLRRTGGDSILSDVIRNSDLTEAELKMLAALLFGAGFITTTHILGKSVIALTRHPDQLATLRANPDGWPNAVEEALRYDTPVQFVPRVAAEDIEIEGYSIRAGEAVFVMYGGANRDPAVFDNPNAFDAARANAREHITFGTGVHTCLGAALGRMEVQIGLQTLFERFPRLSLAGPPVYNHNIGLHGLKHLPVSLG